MAKRKQIPIHVETQVLLRTGRRCCLCFLLSGDLAEKHGQIAHLDHDRSNHAENNLEFLCLSHHSLYDSRTSQHKNYTKQEIVAARGLLQAVVAGSGRRHGTVNRSSRGGVTETPRMSVARPVLDCAVHKWDPRRMPPGALLRADCGNGVPFHFRLRELAALQEWCENTSLLQVRAYTAAGGMGKTRLFLECCTRLTKQGWYAGFHPPPTTPLTFADWSALFKGATPTCLVLDYAENRLSELKEILRAALDAPAARLRIVLLARTAGDWWDGLHRERGGLGDLIRSEATTLLELGPLATSKEQLAQSYLAAIETFATQLGQTTTHLPAPPSLAAPTFDRILLVHMSALMNLEATSAASETALLDYVLARERRFWSDATRTAGLPSLLEDAIAQAMTLITLGGGARDRAHASEVLGAVPLLRDQPALVRRKIGRILHEAYPGRNFIEPMEPDLLGEHLVQAELSRDDGELMSLVFDGR